jgi:hypothetical protein
LGTEQKKPGSRQQSISELKVGLRMQNRFEAEVGDEIKLQWIGC